MKPIGTIQDLIEEAKARTVWWALCIFAISYFFSHTSKSMWMNIPISILLVSMLRILLNEVDFHWKVRSVCPQTYLSHLEKKRLSVNDSRLSSALPPAKWKRKIDSPVVEAAMKDFIDKILKDFVVDLWYSDITSDKEFPEQIRAIIMDVLGEISGRVKEINLVDLLTRDIVDMIADHIDLFRRNEAAIGVDVMGILSSEERDERLKHHLIASKELHPALISPESEYKVLQQLVSGLLAIVLRPREAQSPVVRSIARELVTCLVVQPIMDLVSPVYVNELIEYVLLAFKDDRTKEVGGYLSTNAAGHQRDHSLAGGIVQTGDSTSRKYLSSNNKHTDMTLAEIGNQKETTNSLGFNKFQEDPMQPRPADWARVLDAATQRRTEVLTPENLENMWTKGRHYKKKERKKLKARIQEPISDGALPTRNLGMEMLISRTGSSMGTEEKAMMRPTPRLNLDSQLRNRGNYRIQFSQNPDKQSSFEGGNLVDESVDNSNVATNGKKSCLKRSNSASALRVEPDKRKPFTEGRGTIISEFYSPKFGKPREGYSGTSTSDVVIRSEGPNVPKLKCRVMGAYFENLGSNSFAVYSIAVTDVENRTWFVKRRYRNFERLHRHLKDIPNYTLHLPPKRIFSSSTEDAFVHQRCIQLDKYLQDLLSIANVAEQHEVWDFLSVSSKNYSFGKSSSVMRTLAVNVDDAVDDIVRQFKGVSDGLMRKVVGSSSPAFEGSQISSRYLSWNADELNKLGSSQNLVETANSFSDNEEGSKYGSLGHEEVGSSTRASGWHSDNELNSKGFPPRVIKREEFRKLDPKKKHDLEGKSGLIGKSGVPAISAPVSYCNLEDPIGMPPEWTPPNVSVPLLNLVDKVFQLKRRGWLRRQVFWISKQILQLIMEDAIDDWLLRQIHWLRREDIIAQGIRWVQDILWPDGTFFIRIGNFQSNVDDTQSNQKSSRATSQQDGSKPGSFELQLEAARRASDVKKILFDGAPTALVSLIGHNQYKRCAKDIYYFTQSTICLKQLTYGILELLLISVFPELRDLVLDLHESTEFPKT